MIEHIHLVQNKLDLKGPIQIHSEGPFMVPDLRANQIFLLDHNQQELLQFLSDFYLPEAEVYVFDQSDYKKTNLRNLAEFILEQAKIVVILPQSDLHSGGLNGVVNIVDRLQGPGGCPWDQAQTHQTLQKHLIEETYEAIDAIQKNDFENLREELGDVFLQVVLNTQISQDTLKWNAHTVANELIEKLIRRHPHVFGDVQANNPEEALRSWNKMKEQEKLNNKNNKKTFVLDGIPSSLPALMKAHKISKKAAKIGFEWADLDQVFSAIDGEMVELKEAIELKDKKEIELELGDVLFGLVNVARWLKIDPELALEQTITKFKNRFEFMELNSEKPIDECDFEELTALWLKAKSAEKENLLIV